MSHRLKPTEARLRELEALIWRHPDQARAAMLKYATQHGQAAMLARVAVYPVLFGLLVGRRDFHSQVKNPQRSLAIASAMQYPPAFEAHLQHTSCKLVVTRAVKASVSQREKLQQELLRAKLRQASTSRQARPAMVHLVAALA